MLKTISICLLIASLTSPALAGQETGGGPKALATELFSQPVNPSTMFAEIPRLNLPVLNVSADDYRRANARLSVSPQVNLRVKLSDSFQTMEVKNLEGAIVDLKELIQVLPEQSGITP